MLFNDLLNLSREQATELLARYWSLRDAFLLELSEQAEKRQFQLPATAAEYSSAALQILGRFVESIVLNRSGFDPRTAVEPWLAELLDPIDAGRGLVVRDFWLAAAASYAFSSTLLNCVPSARLGIGKEKGRRYIFKNQPVIHGNWHERGLIREVSPLAIGKNCVRGLKEGRYGPACFMETFETIVQYARRTGRLHDRQQATRPSTDDDSATASS